ncbi:hypothetical protein SFR_1172 [Streptomyces sp. FR-008]|nr:hypothetical protein SFR_1172 [Streptomyces sp. FR-008]
MAGSPWGFSGVRSARHPVIAAPVAPAALTG